MSSVREGSVRSRWGTTLGAVLCAALMVGGVSPSWAAVEGDDPGGGSPLLGAMPLGAGVHGALDERSGGFSFEVPLGGVSLAWDSRGSGEGGFGFGPRWAVAGIAFIDTEGGVRVVPSRGARRAFEADDSVPSGLAGYVGDDLRFTQTPGVLPARADGVVGEREYAFVLRELGGVVSYFDVAGDPVAKADAHGNRIEWKWLPGHRLAQVVTEHGVVTELDWSDPSSVEVRARAGAGEPRLVGAVRLDGGRVVEMTDASGARTTVTYAPTGLVSRIATASGAVTSLTWNDLPDGTSAAERVSVTDSITGEPLVERRWEVMAGLTSGWPASADATTHWSGWTGPEFRTAVTDGVNRVATTYDGGQAMTDRETSARSSSGERVLQRQRFSSPERDGGVPGRADQPSGMDLTLFNAAGATKTVSEGFVFDTYGRVAERTAADGTVTRTEYEGALQGEASEPQRVPIGMPVLERTEAPDGSVTETRYTLNEARTAVTVAETFAGTVGHELTRTGRSEFEVDPDGFVSTERVFPQGGEGEPVITEHRRSIDLQAGTMTTTETIAAHTDLAGTTTTVTDLLHGQQVAATDPLGRTATTSYDEAGRPIEVTDAAGAMTRIEHRTRLVDDVNATVTTGPDRVAVTEERDAIGRIVRVLDNVRDGVATAGHARVAETRAYPAPDTVRVTDAWGWETTTVQDAFGRVVHSRVTSGLTQVAEYDEVAGTGSSGYTMTGNLADAELITTEQMDLTGRVTGTAGVRADGLPVAETVAEYDGFGRQTGSSDGTADARVEYDVHGNPITTTIDPARTGDEDAEAGDEPADDPLVATRRFDAHGASLEKTLTTAGESRTGGQWAYDVLGREQTVTDQAGWVTSYEYTPDGLIARQTSSAGTVTTNTYDPTTRELTETVTTSPVGDPVRTGYDYDDATGRVTAVFDPGDPDATTVRYAYDAWGNPTRIGYPDGTSIRHEYDEHGRKTRTTDATGATTEFQHDASGLLTGAIQHNADGDEIASVAYAYDDYARVTGIDRGNGVHTKVTFTSASEIASETTTGPDGTVQSARTYTYDPAGNLTTRIDTVTDPVTHEQGTTATAYEYDQHRRLTASTVHAGATTDGTVQSRTGYTLNVSGDITREHVTTDPGGPDQTVQTRDLTYSPTGQLTTITTTHPDGLVETAVQEYDAAGNLTLAADGTRYTYNAGNQPVQETTPAGDTTHTSYWATGDRASVATGEQTTGFYWDDGTLLNDTHTTTGTTRTASYLTALTREARTLTDAATTYAIHDRHGSTTELTDPAGTPTTRYAYTDYGTTTTLHAPGTEPTPDETSRYPFLYSGEYTNPTGTQHLAARTYTPDRFAFTTRDTMPLQNRYGYANTNPITNIDPTGHFAVGDAINAAAIFAGVLFTVVTAWATFGASFAALSPAAIAFAASSATVGLLANVAGSTLAVLGFVNDHHVEFLDEGTRERFTYSEYALMGVGFIATGLTVAPKAVAKVRAAVAPPTQDEPVIQLLTENTTPLDKALKTFRLRAYLSQRKSATDFGRRTKVYEDYQRGTPAQASTFDLELNASGIGLESVLRDYDFAVTRLGMNATDLAGDELFSFLREHRSLIEYAETTFATVRKAAILAFKGGDDELEVFNTLMPALEETADFAAIALLLAS